MAVGDFVFFNQALHDLGNKVHGLASETFHVALVTGATVPTKDTPAPHWGGTGTTNFATNQVPTGTAYTGPTSVSPCTWGLVSGEPTWAAAADPEWAKDATNGFSTAAYAIFFNNTDANKRCIGFVDLNGNKSNVGGPFKLDLDASGGTTRIGKVASVG